MEVDGISQGKPVRFLIDSGSSHSFLSPFTVKRMLLQPQPSGKKLRVSLANGTTILTDKLSIEIDFQLGGFPAHQEFRVLKMGQFQGILGMDWLKRSKAVIHCGRGTLSFWDYNNDHAQVSGKLGKSPLRVVKAHKLVKGLKKGLQIFAITLNKPSSLPNKGDPEWLRNMMTFSLKS